MRRSVDKQRLEELVKNGYSVKQICEQTGFNPTTIRYWINVLSLKIAKRPEPILVEDRVCRYHGAGSFAVRKKHFRCRKCESQAVTLWRQRKKVKLVEHFGGKCVRCGYNKCVQALDFHHIDPASKLFGLGMGFTYSYAKLLKEAEKCELLCANCHREEESKSSRSFIDQFEKERS